MASRQPTFSSLPRELRDMIWDHAVRDDGPGAHFFTIAHLETMVEPNLRATRSTVRKPHSLSYNHSISAPRGTPNTSGRSWTADNRSTYLQDGGLWTACRESREAMQRNYKRLGLSDTLPTPRNRDTRGSDATTNTTKTAGSFHTDGQQLQYFTLLAHDLVCFQPLDLAFTDFVSPLPFVEGTEKHKNLFFSQGLQHIALEFDPTWKVPDELDFREPGDINDEASALAAATIYLEGAHLWFIDYRLRRVAGSDGPILKNRHVFSGTHCRFVEVRWRDNWKLDDGVENVQVPAQEKPCAFEFIDEMEENSREHYRSPELSPDVFLPGGCAKLGVLAFEEIETRVGLFLRPRLVLRRLSNTNKHSY